MPDERTLLIAHLDSVRAHIVSTTDGLTEDQLTCSAAPSGWSIAQMLNHLAFDDEIFWGAAILGGDEEAISLVQDGWNAPVTSGADAVATYRHWSSRTATVLAETNLEQAPLWWPGEEIFPFPAFATSRQVVIHLLVELSKHAGHLDLAREHIDGHQHLVLG